MEHFYLTTLYHTNINVGSPNAFPMEAVTMVIRTYPTPKKARCVSKRTGTNRKSTLLMSVMCMVVRRKHKVGKLDSHICES